MNTTLILALEKWVGNHPEEAQRKPYIIRDMVSYTMIDVLQEMRNKTEVGVHFEMILYNLTIDLISRGKETI